MDQIIAWLSENEAAISAIVGMLALVGFVLGPLYRLFSSRKTSNGTAEPAAHPAGSASQPDVDGGDTNGPAAAARVLGAASGSSFGDAETTLAILPVDDLANDPRDDDWAAELNDDLRTVLVRSSLFKVRFFRESLPLETLAQQGVSYALELRVRPRRDEIRVTAELVDLKTGTHFWSARYTRQLDRSVEDSDFLALQIASQLVPPVISSEVGHALTQGTEHLGASALTRLAYHSFLFSGHDEKTFRETRRLAEAAVRKGPKNARALATRAVSVATAVAFGFSDNQSEDIRQAVEDAEAALHLEPTDGLVLHARGWVCAYFGSYQQGLPYLQKSVESDPTNAHCCADYGYMLLQCGQIDQAEEHVDRAFTLSPQDPRQYIWNFFRGSIAMVRGDLERAIELYEQSIVLMPYSPSYVGKILATLSLGRDDVARETMIAMAERFHPYVTRDKYLTFLKRSKVTPEVLDKARELGELLPESMAS